MVKTLHSTSSDAMVVKHLWEHRCVLDRARMKPSPLYYDPDTNTPDVGIREEITTEFTLENLVQLPNEPSKYHGNIIYDSARCLTLSQARATETWSASILALRGLSWSRLKRKRGLCGITLAIRWDQRQSKKGSLKIQKS
ncbi:hypothetical protein WG66_011315 [Moniliophthora roreri]|nr:hypothetical protein WG66_011315 [Moniliophthora roreri]